MKMMRKKKKTRKEKRWIRIIKESIKRKISDKKMGVALKKNSKANRNKMDKH